MPPCGLASSATPPVNQATGSQVNRLTGMRAVITGGQGFLGQRLARAVLERGLVGPAGEREPVDELVLVDVVAGSSADGRVRCVQLDLSDRESVGAILDGDDDVSVFHLASMVSAESEVAWSRAVAINVGGLVGLVEAARDRSGSTRLVFASSVAVFGGQVISDPVGVLTKQMPQSTYGMTKAMGEMLVNDATRQGFIDGRSARLPTVVVRPGRPNAAASSFFSGMFREPLNGQRCNVPVSQDVGVVMIGPATATDALMALHDVPTGTLGHDRAVPLPGLSVTVAEMIEALRHVGGEEAVSLLDFETDEVIESVVSGWPTQWDDSRGRDLGLPFDSSLIEIVEEHLIAIGT